jgi:[acyl-carrier-protein] S-malonyltransferase
MQVASEEFSKTIDACTFNNASIPVIQNITGMPVTNAQELKINLKKQMTGSVQWTDTVRFLLDPNQGAVTEVIEVGPGKVLAGLIKKQDRRFPVTNISSVSDIVNLLNPALSS